MKKILVAIMAVSTVVLSFTSCGEKTADVNVYPIAGKTFQATEAGGTVKITFHTNFKTTFVVNSITGTVINDNFVWDMDLDTIPGEANTRMLYIKFASGTMDKTTGEIVSGKKAYEGKYNGQNCIIYPTYPEVDKSSSLVYHPFLGE